MKNLFIIVLLAPQILLAKTIFEPSLSLSTGAFQGAIENISSSDVNATFSTLSAGVRYGITREYVHVTAVLEGNYITLDSSAIEAESAFQGNFGIGFGYEWNIPLRTYVILGLPTSSIEVSYYFSESLIIGLRYNRIDVEVAAANASATGDINANTYGVTVSFPIEFDYPSYWWRKKAWE